MLVPLNDRKRRKWNSLLGRSNNSGSNAVNKRFIRGYITFCIIEYQNGNRVSRLYHHLGE